MKLGIMAVPQLSVMHVMLMYSNYGGENNPEHNAHVKY
jgi:hypothetical protein